MARMLITVSHAVGGHTTTGRALTLRASRLATADRLRAPDRGSWSATRRHGTRVWPLLVEVPGECLARLATERRTTCGTGDTRLDEHKGERQA
jgi:hypothetical protein